MSFSSPFIFTFFLFMLLCICFAISLHSSLPPSHTTLIDLMNLSLHFTTTARGSLPQPHTYVHPVLFHLHLRSPSPVLPTLHPHSPTHTITVFTTQFSPFPSQTHTTAPLSSLSPSTLPSNFLHQPHWDPNTRGK